MELEHYFDISPEVSDSISVYPGDQPYRRHVSLDFTEAQNVRLSSIETTLHVGAHADAPGHYDPEGLGISACDLRRYFGLCQVVTARLPAGARILPAHLAGSRIRAPRVLLKTDSFPDADRWSADYNSLSPELVDWLSAQHVVLIGIDTPSIDPAGSQALEAHQAIRRNGVSNLEGLRLAAVPEGLYTLVALPLRLKDADASPVRAILIRV